MFGIVLTGCRPHSNGSFPIRAARARHPISAAAHKKKWQIIAKWVECHAWKHSHTHSQPALRMRTHFINRIAQWGMSNSLQIVYNVPRTSACNPTVPEIDIACIFQIAGAHTRHLQFNGKLHTWKCIIRLSFYAFQSFASNGPFSLPFRPSGRHQYDICHSCADLVESHMPVKANTNEINFEHMRRTMQSPIEHTLHAIYESPIQRCILRITFETNCFHL